MAQTPIQLWKEIHWEDLLHLKNGCFQAGNKGGCVSWWQQETIYRCFFSSFVDQILSLLHNPKTMSKDKIIKDYDIFTGKCGNDFWDSIIIDHKDSMVDPVSLGPNINISDITSSYTFSRRRFPLLHGAKSHVRTNHDWLRKSQSITTGRGGWILT